MPLGNRRYFQAVPRDERELADAMGLEQPNWYVRSHDALPVYPQALRDLLRRHKHARHGDNGNGNGNGHKRDGAGTGEADNEA